MLNSNRAFWATICEGGRISDAKFTLAVLVDDNNQDEFIFALQDSIDAVLDLKKGEAMYFQPNRDNRETKAIILRIK